MKLGGASAIVAFAARWVFFVQRDIQRTYARRSVEAEERIKALEAALDQERQENDRWREAYYGLRSQARLDHPQDRGPRAHRSPDEDDDARA
jgi:hypothetical protein